MSVNIFQSINRFILVCSCLSIYLSILICSYVVFTICHLVLLRAIVASHRHVCSHNHQCCSIFTGYSILSVGGNQKYEVFFLSSVYMTLFISSVVLNLYPSPESQITGGKLRLITSIGLSYLTWSRNLNSNVSVTWLSPSNQSRVFRLTPGSSIVN